jgi:hypothetical protein
MVTTRQDGETNARSTAPRSRLMIEHDEDRWALVAAVAQEGARERRAFRAYLERHGDPASDFDAAEAVYGELVNTCVRHAPGQISIEFRWNDATLIVVDARERLRSWPFSPDDTRAESTHHAYALISAYTGRIQVTRDAGGGTRASVALPVMKARL